MRTKVLWLVIIGLCFVWPVETAFAQLQPDEANMILEIAGDLKAKLEGYQQLMKDLRTELFQCAKPLQDLIKNISTATGESVAPTKSCLEKVLRKIQPPTLDPVFLIDDEVTPTPEESLFVLRSEVLAAYEQLRTVIAPLLRIKRTAGLAKLLDSRLKSMRSHLGNELSAVSQGWQRIVSIVLTLDAVSVLLDDAETYDGKLEPEKAAAVRARAKEVLQGKVWRTLLQATQLLSRSLTFLKHTQLVLNLLINSVIRRTEYSLEASGGLGTSLATAELSEVWVYDINGRLLWHGDSSGGELTAQLRTWPNGVYWVLMAHGAQHRELRKFVVLH